ncbi:MAG: hypothetical protein GKR88_11220 [Flavobacteriaceae bacterium]|nr:MAG: hypothetical protein GKR88_11220 [Flavobacteriaceae bacterium]
MDLDQYKKAWDNQPETTEKLSAVEIYKMSQSRSSSIVKWIFIIGLLEFAFWFGLNLVMPKDNLDIYEKLNLMGFIRTLSYIHYALIILFLAIFYKNYTSISTIDNTKTLIKKILVTRKTVKFYVYYNLISFVVSAAIVNILIFNSPENIKIAFNLQDMNVDPDKVMSAMIIVQIILIIVILALLLLFYYLLYGILLKKLNKNYKELNKLEKNDSVIKPIS